MNKIKDIFHRFIAWFSSVTNGNPSAKLIVIGVTGTKGKSMTTELAKAVLESQGGKVAVLNSVHEMIGDKEYPNPTPNTMPGRGYIQKFLARAANEGAKYAIIEVASQGVTQHRHENIEWNGGVFVNIHPEHIESHGSFENYREAKLDFFRYAAISPKTDKKFFINKDDPSAELFAEAAGDNEKDFFSGTFIKANYAAAEAIGRAYGIGEENIKKALQEFKGLPGRMETVYEEDYKIIVDYAHTPDSLEEAYNAASLPLRIRGVNSGEKAGRLICVLGSCGGGRDKWKRPKMGEVVSRHCDITIVTNEDPYDEDPMAIMEEVASGIRKGEKDPIMMIDREEAIEKAVALAEKGDVIMITGKGCEKYIHLARGRKLFWSDKDKALQAIANKNKI